MNAHRAALDHVLTLIAESRFAEWLVLRGSMTMPAWVGDAARPPGDLDWVVRSPSLTPLDDLDPYPYFNRLAPVQQWPEAAHGAVRNEIWEFEEFDTGGRQARLPPEGLHWVPAAGLDSFGEELWDDQFVSLIRRNPRTSDGIQFDADSIDCRQDWDYAEYEPGGENGRLRFALPWKSPTGEEGTVQVDLSFGEPMPDTPVCTAVPRAGGLPPLGLWTATAPLSLAWKLHWLAADQQTHGESAMKDVYDAVLLGELDGMRLRPRLRRLALGAGSSPVRALQPYRDSAPVRTSASPGDGPASPPAYRNGPSPLGQPLDPASPPASRNGANPLGQPLDPASPADPQMGPYPLARLLHPAGIRRWAVSGTVAGAGDPATWLSRLAAVATTLL
ncbi:nucleotidyl transferase AbiEii/AbiGii toxin family protein [Actinoplanes sp. NPDC023801]|uniref:nucleotidyl transferase AbiEii/AbiGii toxin family protein n=1 Tax=Actinoplanes sp. NPDC023801 TaxID=3154595 RepID=UPI0033DCA626